jgi:ankyrin repeat protein
MLGNKCCWVRFAVVGLFALPSFAQVPPASRPTPSEIPATEPAKTGDMVFPSGRDSVEIPLREALGELFVDRVKIHGRDAGTFLLDTGCNRTVILPSCARQIGLSLVPTSVDNPELAEAKSLSVGGVTLSVRQVEVFEVKGLSQFFGGRISGILGGDFLSAAPFTIDPADRILTLYRRQQFSPPKAAASQIEMDLSDQVGDNPSYGSPTVAGKVNGLDCRFMLDTGCLTHIELLGSFTDKHLKMVDRSFGPVPSEVSGYTDGRGYRAYLSNIELFRRKIIFDHSVDEDYIGDGDPVSPCLAGVGALAGIRTLRDFRMTFDYRAGVLWAEPKPVASIASQVRTTGLDPNGRDLADWTPLMTAATFDDSIDEVKLLLNDGARPDADEFHGKTVLYFAAKFGDPTIVNRLLRIASVAAQVNTAAADGTTPLMAAMDARDPAVTIALLKAGADATAVDHDGETALHYAAMRGNTAAVPLLVAANANVNLFDEKGMAPLALAAENGNIALFDTLIKCGASAAYKDNTISVLHGAAGSGNVELVRHILDLPIAQIPGLPNVDAMSANGTPLMYAAGYDRPRTAALLIERGADVNAVTTIGNKMTPLFKAAGYGHADVAELLVRHHADVQQVCEHDWTALSAAAQQGDPATVKVLLDAGARVDVYNDDHVTPLRIAVSHGNTEAARLLLNAGADPFAKANDGMTALMVAKQSDDPELRSLFVDAVKRPATQPVQTRP